MHIKKTRKDRPKKVTEEYIGKVCRYFKEITSHMMLMELVKSTETPSFLLDRVSQSDLMSEKSFSTLSHAAADHMPNVMEMESCKKLFKGRTKFFVAKSFDFANIKISKEKSVWSTS